MKRVLIIDDDVELCRLLEQYLGGEGFAVTCAHDGRGGLGRLGEEDFDVAILDVMLPDQTGFDVLGSLRKTHSIPVIMLTARGEDIDRIVGLEMGADDYLPKPFNPRELVARLRAILRRANAEVSRPRVRAGDLAIDSGSRAAMLNDHALALTTAEFNVLERLVRDAGNVVDKESLCQDALGRELQPYDRAIDMHVSNLRKKLGPLSDGSPRIRTVRGVGYMYVSLRGAS